MTYARNIIIRIVGHLMESSFLFAEMIRLRPLRINICCTLFGAWCVGPLLLTAGDCFQLLHDLLLPVEQFFLHALCDFG